MSDCLTSSSRTFRTWTTLVSILALALLVPIAHADNKKGKKAPAPPGPSIVGNWSGQLTQVGSQTPYKFELVIGPRGAETTYPDLDCTGTLTRVGASKSYVFFVEIITKGAVDKGGRCPDGTITVARAGNDLALFWFGSIESNTIVAYGTLSKK